MEKLLALCCFLLLFAEIVNGQKSPEKFGDITMEDMTMEDYPMDTSAVAVILLDYGESTVERGINQLVTKFKKHQRIKILKKGGLSYGSVTIGLYKRGSSNQTVSGLKGATYNLEGGKIVSSPLAKENIFLENFNSNIDFQKISLPNVQQGSIIEVSYIIDSDFPFIPDWHFQVEKIPVKHSEFWSIRPSSFDIQKFVKGYLTPKYEFKKLPRGRTTADAEHWIMDDIPSFNEEPYLTSKEDYISGLNFSFAGIETEGYSFEIMRSWESLVASLNVSPGFGKVISKSDFLKSKADEITAGITDPMKKINAVDAWVKTNIEWNGKYSFTSRGLRKVIEEKHGTSGDINLLMAALLDKVGIPVEMVMLSTRDHGFVRMSFPMTRQFNYAVCSTKLNGKTLLLDATSKYLPVTMLPSRCISGLGLVIAADNSAKWIGLSSNITDKIVTSGDFVLTSTGELIGKFSVSRDGYAAAIMRGKYFSDGESKYINDFLKSHPWKVSSTRFINADDKSKPVSENHEVSIEEHASVAGDVIYVNPFVDARIDDNPFKSETRLYPVDFGQQIERLDISKITLPDGFAVDELPTSVAIVLPENGGRFIFNASQIGNAISVSSNFQLKKTLFNQADYPLLREFYAQVIAKMNEQIVVRKKN